MQWMMLDAIIDSVVYAEFDAVVHAVIDTVAHAVINDDDQALLVIVIYSLLHKHLCHITNLYLHNHFNNVSSFYSFVFFPS